MFGGLERNPEATPYVFGLGSARPDTKPGLSPKQRQPGPAQSAARPAGPTRGAGPAPHAVPARPNTLGLMSTGSAISD